MNNFLKKDINVIFVSIICAIFLWAYVYYKGTPFQEDQAMANFVVPLEVRGLLSNKIVTQKPDNVIVKIKGKKEIISNLNIEDRHVNAFIDLANKAEGFYTIKVQAKCFSGEVVEVEPENVDILIDTLEHKDFTVQLAIKGKPRSGYEIDEKKNSVYPEIVDVKGPIEIVSRVQTVSAEVNVSRLYLSFRRGEVPLKAFDKNGLKLEGLYFYPPTVEVSVEISPEKLSKVVAIMPSLYGILPEGYMIKRLNVQPMTAIIEIKRSDIAKVDTIRTEPINLSGKTSDIVTKSSLFIPNGVRILSEGSVQVIIDIEKLSPPEKKSVPTPKNK